MSERYVAFDVETPNYANNRISAIGICIVQDGEIVDRFYSLVNPQARFERFHVQLTGITPHQSASAPTFPELWTEIAPRLASGVLAAHNASFDLQVLSQCLDAYGIFWKSACTYICTCELGKICFPFLENHKLDTMCRALHIGLEHHHSSSNCLACAELLRIYLQHNLDLSAYIRRYQMSRRCTG